MTTFQNLNTVNEELTLQMAQIQVDIDNTQACETLEQECAHLYARGKSLLWLPQMATQLTGHFMAKIEDVIEERPIQFMQQAKVATKLRKQYKVLTLL